MADLNELQATGITKLIGADASANEQTPVQSTANGGLHINVRNNAGTESGTTANPFIVAGAGVAGTPAGGVHSIQGVAGGTAVPSSQSGTWTVTAAEDKNYGTVGATTLRVASQIGNATGSADFNAGATGAQTLRTVANQGAPNTNANGWFMRITNATNNAGVTATGDLQVADIVNTAGQARAQSITTSAAEALGAATILANRKFISVTPTNGTVYWGFTSGVTTANGTPIFKNQTMVFAFGVNVHVFLIASGTVDCRIAEGS